MNPAFLLERVCGSAQLWEVREAINQRQGTGEMSQSEANKARGGFGKYRGAVAEKYVVDLIKGDLRVDPNHRVRSWDGEEMEGIWPGQSICDLIIERNRTLLAVEVVSHAMRETAASGGDFEGLAKDLQIAVIEKAEQLDAVISRINKGGIQEPRIEYEAIYPVLVNAMRFPWNALIDQAIRVKFKELGLLQQPNVRPFVIMSVEEVEALAAVVECGLATFESVLEDRFRHGRSGEPIQWTVSRGYGISRPTIVNDAFGRAADALIEWRTDGG